jgi:hypothetical protein
MIGTESLAGLIAFGLLCGVYLGPWQWAWADHARQAVFDERDAIFDMAYAQDLTFGSDAYETVRASLNALIRFAHRATLPRLLFHQISGRPTRAEMSRIRTVIAEIDDQNTRERVLEHVQRAEAVLVGSMFARSLLTAILFLLLLWIRSAWITLSGGSKAESFRDTIERVGIAVRAEAEAVGA